MSAPSAAVGLEQCAPVSGWRRLASDSLLVGGSTVVCHALGAMTSLTFRVLLDPAQIGVWQGLKIFLSYANYANLGVSKAASRELCIELGRGAKAPAERSLKLAHSVNTLSSLLYGIVLLGAALWQSRSATAIWSDPWALGLLVIAALAAVQRHVTFQVTILRSRQAFRAATRLSIQEALLTLIVCGAAAWMWGLRGLYLGTIFVLFGSLWFLRRQRLPTLGWAWNSREILRLIGIGGPILLAGVATSLFGSLDKLMILGYLDNGDFHLGCYSVALMVSAQLYGLGNMLSVAAAARYGELFGRTGDRRQVARLAGRISEIQGAAMALAGSLAIVLAPPILARLLPDYQTGLPALTWLVVGTLAAVAALPAGQHLVAVEGGRRVLCALAVGIAAAAIGNHWALMHGWGITGVAAATAVANVIYLILLAALALWRDFSGGQRLRYVFSLLGTIALPLGLAAVLQAGSSNPSPEAATVAAKAGAVLTLWALIVMVGWRFGGWRDMAREFGA